MEINKKQIKILGAGLSGLTAAINLAKAGFEVEVFEQNSDCGMRFHGDKQGLENWSDDENVLKSLKSQGVRINFLCTPFEQLTFTNGDISEDFVFPRPLFYLIKRGTERDAIDQGFKDQALKAGVVINFNKSIDRSEADIISTGPLGVKKVYVADKGIIFKTDLKNVAIGLINNQAAYKGYAYLLVVDGVACLCTCIFDDLTKLEENFEYAKDYFVRKYNLEIKDPQPVGGIGNFSMKNKFIEGKSLLVGEAAGIQDFLAGFGMRTAIKSGFLAAQSIIKNKDYEAIAKKEFSKYLKAGIVNRYIWEHEKFDNYIELANKLNSKDTGLRFLKSIYNLNFLQKLYFNRANKYIKKLYPEIY